MTAAFLLLFGTVSANAERPCPKAASSFRQTSAPCTPSKTDSDAIMKELEAWRLHDQKAKRDEIEEARLRAQALANPSNRRYQILWSDMLNRLNDNRQQATAAAKRAIALTQDYYRVGPAVKNGRIANGPIHGEKVYWTPVLLKGDKLVYRTTLKDGKDYYLKTEEDGTHYGKTMDDGTVFITELCFDKALEYGSPAILASTLHHEGSHFDGLVGKGWESHEQSERIAIARELQVDEDIGLEPDEIADSKTTLGKLNSSHKRTPPFPNEGLSAANMKEWGDIQSRLRAIREQRDRLNHRLATGHDRHDPLNDADEQPEQTGECGTGGSVENGVPIPPLPCPDNLFAPPPGGSPGVAVALPTPQPAVAAPARPAPFGPPLAELAERICAEPAFAQTEAARSLFRSAPPALAGDGNGMPGCVGGVYRALLKTNPRTFDGRYLQDLASSLLNHSSPPADSHVPSVGPSGPRVPECLQRDGGRCIRWR